MTMDAMRLLRTAEIAKYRAETQLTAAESVLAAAGPPAAIQSAEEAKAEVLARLAEAEAQLVAAKAEAPLKTEAAAHAREEAREAGGRRRSRLWKLQERRRA